MHITPALNILCFGDSITAGFCHWGTVYHPYADSMLSSLKEAWNTSNITANMQGATGDQVTTPPGGYLTRMDILYEENEIQYDWAIILGGTNDLSVKRKGKDIYEALKKVWAFPLSNGTKVLSLTVPECGFCDPKTDKARNTLNSLIMKHKAKNYYTLDLKSEIPYWSMPEERRKEIWGDGLHFSEKGYDFMGEVIAKRLVELVAEIESGERVKDVKHELKARDKKPKTKPKEEEGRRLRSGKSIAP